MKGTSEFTWPYDMNYNHARSYQALRSGPFLCRSQKEAIQLLTCGVIEDRRYLTGAMSVGCKINKYEGMLL